MLISHRGTEWQKGGFSLLESLLFDFAILLCVLLIFAFFIFVSHESRTVSQKVIDRIEIENEKFN